MVAVSEPNARGFYLDKYERPFGLRWFWCDERSGRINHTGWFADEHQDDKFRGMVFRLTHDRGFLIGWSMGTEMCSTIEFNKVYKDEGDAIQQADELARVTAEAEWQYRDEAPDVPDEDDAIEGE